MKRLFLLLACLSFSLSANEPADILKQLASSRQQDVEVGSHRIIPKNHRQIVCLNMIVKNETDVLERCIKSVKPIIDYWVIVDTGSTDGTQTLIQELMKDVPGALYERPWKNFGHNRDEALTLAREELAQFSQDYACYVLFLDADQVMQFDENFKFPDLNQDGYYIRTGSEGFRYDQLQLISAKGDFSWKGVLHEYVDCTHPYSRGAITGLLTYPYPDGARSKDPKKYEKDAAVLEEALKEDPNNARHMFYLGQSYKDAGLPEKSIEAYRRRVEMGGWDQEAFWSLLQIANQTEKLKLPMEQITHSYFDAYQYRPTRAEPLFYLAQYYRNQDDFAACYTISRFGLTIKYPGPEEILFVEKWVYDYGLLLENSIAAYWIGKYAESKMGSEKILALKNLPQNVRECVERNLAFANEKLGCK